jgi:TonB family protein
MFKKKAVVFIGFFLAVSLFCLSAGEKLNIKLRVYEGAKEGTQEPLRYVTSSFLQSTFAATIQTEFELENEREKIKRVFNLQDVSLLTETDLVVGEKAQDIGRHYFRLNGNEYRLMIRLIDWKGMGQFLIVISEIIENKGNNVLTTGITLPGGNAAVFGFEDKKGKPYFLSFHITSVIGPDGEIIPPPPPLPPPPPKKRVDKDTPLPPPPPRKADKEVPLPPDKADRDVPQPPQRPSEEELKKFAEGAIVVIGDIIPPKAIKMVAPIYPKKARKEGVKGTVWLGVRTDENGNVVEVKVLRSVPLLDQAAVDAVKQWKYEPFLSKGKPTPVVFSVGVTFRLR